MKYDRWTTNSHNTAELIKCLFPVFSTLIFMVSTRTGFVYVLSSRQKTSRMTDQMQETLLAIAHVALYGYPKNVMREY